MVKSLTRKLQKVSSRESDLQVGHDQFLEGWKRSPEGLAFLGKMASHSYRMAVWETKERQKGILAGPDSSLNWSDIEAEFDLSVAEEHRMQAEKKTAANAAAKKKDVPQTSASKALEAPV